MSDLQRMVADLESIVAHLRRLGRPVPDLLLPGFSQDEIEDRAAGLPFLLPRELDCLYRWRNGTLAREGDRLSDLNFLPGFYLPSLDEAAQIYGERERAPQWRAGWFPVFADGAGDFYIIPCTQEKVEDAPIIGFLHGEPEQDIEYESLAAMIATMEACYAEGAYFVNEDGYLDIDDERHRQIAHRFNPGVAEWQD
jgi:hypothetical protein